MKILLVDDDAFLRDMYATKFTESGDDVHVAQNGTEALNKIGTEKFDVIIMDMVMPGMNGLELLASIRAHKTAATTKCIILSNQGEATDIQAAKDIGVDGYIVKAESIPSEVVSKVHTILSN